MSLKADLILAPAPTTTRGRPTPLSADPRSQRLAYASQKSIFLRSIDHPNLSTQYTGHLYATSVARFSPSGYYVASGDVAGTLRVWDCVGEGSTRGEYTLLSGRINDLAWDGDSARLVAVGEGRERYGACVTADSGNTVGEITGHSSPINAVAVRGMRPLRAATASDDLSLGFFHGVPFRYQTSVRGVHKRFVYGTAFSPDGASLVSVGADGRIVLYDGKTGELRGPIGEGVHAGSVFGVSWGADSRHFATAGADQSVRLWDVEAGKTVQEWRLGDEGVVSVPDHQVGVVWPAGRQDGLVVSLALNGDLNYLVQGTEQPQRKVQGHQKNVTVLEVDEDQTTLWTGGSDGRVCSWDAKAGAGEALDGTTHSNYVAGIAAAEHGPIYSVGWDDTLRSIDSSAKTVIGAAVKTDGQPKGVAAVGKETIVATHKGIEVFVDHKTIGKTPTTFAPTCLAATKGLVAVGGDDSALHIFSSSASSLSVLKDIPEAASSISALSFSPDGAMLAVGFANGKISVYKCSDWIVGITRWSSHTGRITQIAWNKAGSYAISGALDGNIFVWSVAKPGMRINMPNAHKDGVNGVGWLAADRICSVGFDAAIKTWSLLDLP